MLSRPEFKRTLRLRPRFSRPLSGAITQPAVRNDAIPVGICYPGFAPSDRLENLPQELRNE